MVLKHGHEKLGFIDLRGLNVLVIVGSYYCIQSFCHMKTSLKRLKKFILDYCNGA